MKQSRARMCQALLLYGCFFTAPFDCTVGRESHHKAAVNNDMNGKFGWFAIRF